MDLHVPGGSAMVEIAGTGITLRHLQILREVIRARSERAAAAVLGITQPAVSQQLKQLEALLAVQLFVRDKGRLLPTAQATALFRDTDATFAQMDRIAKTVTSIKGIDSDTISIAAPYVFSMKLIPEAIRALRLRQPVHGIQLKSGSYHEIAAHARRAGGHRARPPAAGREGLRLAPCRDSDECLRLLSRPPVLREGDNSAGGSDRRTFGGCRATDALTPDERKCAALHGRGAASGNSGRYHRPGDKLCRRGPRHHEQQYFCRAPVCGLPRRVSSIRA